MRNPFAQLTQREQLLFATMMLLARRRVWRREPAGVTTTAFALSDNVGVYPVRALPVSGPFTIAMADLKRAGLIAEPRTGIGELALTSRGRDLLGEVADRLGILGMLNTAIGAVPPKPGR